MVEAPIQRIIIPNPFFEGATNVYLIAAEPITLIDTGIGTEEGFQVLEQALRSHGMTQRSIQRIVLTHQHLDHIGLARRLHDVSGAAVFVHAADWEAVTHYEAWHTNFVTLMRERLTAWGAPEADIQEASDLFLHGGLKLAQSVPAERLTDGQRLPMGTGELEVFHTPGHSLGSICLRFGRHLFSGDHVLPDVSPNIGGGDFETPNLLRRYLESLERVRHLQADDLRVHPGHGEPFADLAGRVRELQEHHREREETILELLHGRGSLTVYEIAVALFGPLRGHHVALGTAEVYAHLEKAEREGRISVVEKRYELARGGRTKHGARQL